MRLATAISSAPVHPLKLMPMCLKQLKPDKMKRFLSSFILFFSLLCAEDSRAQSFLENFENVSNGMFQFAAGWDTANLSSPRGNTGWFHGNNDYFGAYADTAYIAADYNNTDSAGSTD